MKGCMAIAAGLLLACSAAERSTEPAGNAAGRTEAAERDPAAAALATNSAGQATADASAAGPPSGATGGEEDDSDRCGASRYQWLVGRPRSAIPPQPAGANWRTSCTGCPITMDYSAARLNIFYDSEAERIDEVRCG